MSEYERDPHTVIVMPSGELDGNATHRLLRDVSERTSDRTRLIVVSFARTTSVRWNALCMLAHAARTWRAATYDVVLREARPSLRAMLDQHVSG